MSALCASIARIESHCGYAIVHAANRNISDRGNKKEESRKLSRSGRVRSLEKITSTHTRTGTRGHTQREQRFQPRIVPLPHVREKITS